jgi:hypothetical protein
LRFASRGKSSSVENNYAHPKKENNNHQETTLSGILPNSEGRNHEPVQGPKKRGSKGNPGNRETKGGTRS